MNFQNFARLSSSSQKSSTEGAGFLFMKAKPLPSLKYLNECFELDSTCPSGLRWKVRPTTHFETCRGWGVHKAQYSGKAAGTLLNIPHRDQQYFRIKISDILYLAHRIVYSLHHNIKLSTEIEIDHEDGNGLNNIPTNLRLATCSENQYNVKLQRNNSSGSKGVIYTKKGGTWFGQIEHSGKRYLTGHSPSKEVITELVRELRERLHKEFCNHG